MSTGVITLDLGILCDPRYRRHARVPGENPRPFGLDDGCVCVVTTLGLRRATSVPLGLISMANLGSSYTFFSFSLILTKECFHDTKSIPLWRLHMCLFVQHGFRSTCLDQRNNFLLDKEHLQRNDIDKELLSYFIIDVTA
jgi:hypothetical protein